MERVKKKPKGLSRIFAGYIIGFCMTAVFLLLLYMIIFQSFLNRGIIRRADYYENAIENSRSVIAHAEDVSEAIPDGCGYSLYDKEGNVIEKNVTDDRADVMWNVIHSGGDIKDRYFYKYIDRDDGTICIVEYRIMAVFTNPVLRKYIPNAEMFLICMPVIAFLITVAVFSKSFKKRISKEMDILKDATEKIGMENLDFDVSYSGISEINEVIDALDKMKKELKKSLDSQWRMEEERKEQISALAHDIKTPLTIIKGNSELLKESELGEDESVFNDSILEETSNMESYIKSLIELIKSENAMKLKIKDVELKLLLNELSIQGRGMAMHKGIFFETEIHSGDITIKADEGALKRAVGNAISNAADYCPEGGKILLSSYPYGDYIEIIVEDSGRGFTLEELKMASQQFFQGDKSRSAKNHYGMGLYIAKTLMESMGGSMELQNSERLKGAKVIFKIRK